MADDLARLSSDLRTLVKALDGPQMDGLLTKIGVEAKKDVEAAVRGDIGDLSMSNWRRKKPIQVGARFDLKGSGVEITPTPRSRGPMRVLEEGRKGGGAYDLVLTGRPRKDGTRRGKSRGRNVGGTAGKNTWSDAEQLIRAGLPKVTEEGVMKIVRDVLGG